MYTGTGADATQAQDIELRYVNGSASGNEHVSSLLVICMASELAELIYLDDDSVIRMRLMCTGMVCVEISRLVFSIITICLCARVCGCCASNKRSDK